MKQRVNNKKEYLANSTKKSRNYQARNRANKTHYCAICDYAAVSTSALAKHINGKTTEQRAIDIVVGAFFELMTTPRRQSQRKLAATQRVPLK